MSTAPGFKTILYACEQKEALVLWRSGLDTKQIATKMNAEEYAVYNGLHEIREFYREAAEVENKYGLRLVPL